MRALPRRFSVVDFFSLTVGYYQWLLFWVLPMLDRVFVMLMLLVFPFGVACVRCCKRRCMEDGVVEHVAIVFLVLTRLSLCVNLWWLCELLCDRLYSVLPCDIFATVHVSLWLQIPTRKWQFLLSGEFDQLPLVASRAWVVDSAGCPPHLQDGIQIDHYP